MKGLVLALGGLATLGLAGFPQAQEVAAWDLQSEGPDRLVASILFANGPGLAVQCSGGVFDVALLNLPPAPADAESQRKLETGLDLADLEDHYWQARAGSSTALAFTAARRARSLRAGGVYYVKVPGTDGQPPVTFALPMPTESSGIHRVLEACGKPVVEPRDDLPEVNDLLDPERWAFRSFELIPPERAVRAGGGMTRVEVSCLIAPAGRVHDCRIESETPHGMGVGGAMLRMTDRVRLNFGENADAAVGGII